MGYTIGQVAKKFGLSAHTLRYYDKEGLLPFVNKTSSGLRSFAETDIEWLIIIDCLKGTGMTLKDIKQYIDWCIQGDSTLEQRLDMFKQQKLKVAEQIAKLKECQEKINYKIAYYTEAVNNGSDDIYKKNQCLAAEKKRLFKI